MRELSGDSSRYLTDSLSIGDSVYRVGPFNSGFAGGSASGAQIIGGK